MTESTSTLSNLKVGAIAFPGSNCEPDCEWVFNKYFGIKIEPIWHLEKSLPQVEALIVPGGFSFGDYLRSGHLASLSPCIQALRAFAKKGFPILGICNGFQILTESGLLPGTLLPNINRRFICKTVELKVSKDSPKLFQSLLGNDKVLKLPIAHGEGRYFIDEKGLKQIQDRSQIAFEYCENPNGSVNNIAGVCSPNGKILGLMPHPERACDHRLNGPDGLAIIKAFLASFL